MNLPVFRLQRADPRGAHPRELTHHPPWETSSPRSPGKQRVSFNIMFFIPVLQACGEVFPATDLDPPPSGRSPATSPQRSSQDEMKTKLSEVLMDDRQHCLQSEPLIQYTNEDTNQCKAFELQKERKNQHIYHTQTPVCLSPNAGSTFYQW